MKFQDCDQHVLRVPMNRFDLPEVKVTELSNIDLFLDRKLDSIHL